MKKKILEEVTEYAKIILIVLVVTTLLNTLVFNFSTVQQRSMERTLIENDVLIIDKFSYLINGPKFGDIIVFVEEQPVAKNFLTKVVTLFQDMGAKITFKKGRERLVKRVIGVPGDEIVIKEGYLYVNGEVILEPYVASETYAKVITYPYIVPENEYFVMGDNRDVSRDSREFGSIPMDHIEGKAFFRVLPFSKLMHF